MKQTFLNVLNMSITASYVILFVLLARVLLKKAPKVFSYALWGAVLFRLISPFSFSSALSIFGYFKAPNVENINPNIGYIAYPQLDPGMYTVNNLANSLPSAAVSTVTAGPKMDIGYIFSLLWAAGVICLIIYSFISYIRLKRNVRTAVLVSDNILRCEKIKSPFVLGIIKPKIYMPVGLSENEEEYILMHEKTHIKRLDYLIKLLAFLVLCFHWFNPFVWLAFILMSRDMEMSCDEGVLRKMGKGIKKDYSSSLLALSVDRRMLSGSPLAFGESSAKSRIKNVLNYKKPGFWVLAVSVVLVCIVGVGLIANPKNKKDMSYLTVENTASAASQRENFIVRIKGGGASLIHKKEFDSFFGTASDSWSKRNAPLNSKLTPDLSVYINIGSQYKLNFYESELELASIEYKGMCRYYKIPKDTYQKLFMTYALKSYWVPEEVMKAVADGKVLKRQSVQDSPNNGSYKVLKVGDEEYCIYEKAGRYYVEKPYEFISEITQEAYKGAIEFAVLSETNAAKASEEIKKFVDDNIAAIILSSRESSDPNDYINDKAYQDILKRGEDAYSYMISEFQNGRVENDLRGQIMMRLTRELLGARDNVTEDNITPKEWFNRLNVRQKVPLPDFTYEGNDPGQKLVYSTEIEKNKSRTDNFTIVAPHIFGSYEEGEYLKVFVTTFSQSYSLYDKALSEEGGSIVPSAITYKKDASGSYILEKYEQAKDGSYFSSSIKDFCVMPKSGKKIEGLADKILKHYGSYSDIIELQRENLIEHLKKNNQFNVFLIRKQYQKPDEMIPLT